MIIKSLSRKTPSYAQLVAYMERDAEQGFEIRQNIPPFTSHEEVVSSFERLAQQLPPRKNGNMLYHEILSVKREPNVDVKLQQKALFRMAYEYLRCRAPEQLAYGKVHVEPEHVHVHLMISPSGVDAPSQRIRLAKQAFQDIQKQMEHWLQRTYPQLQQETVYNNEGPRFRNEKRTPDREFQLEKRTKAASKKRQLLWKLQSFLSMSIDQDEFKRYLATDNIEFYTRGKHSGIIVEGTKHRLSTLGLKDEFDALNHEKTEETKEPSADNRAQAQRVYLLHLKVKELFLNAQSYMELGKQFEAFDMRLSTHGDTQVITTADGTYTLEELGIQEIYEAAMIRLQGNSIKSKSDEPSTKSRQEKSAYDNVRYARRKEARTTQQTRTEDPKITADPLSEQQPLSRYEERLQQRRNRIKQRSDIEMDGP